MLCTHPHTLCKYFLRDSFFFQLCEQIFQRYPVEISRQIRDAFDLIQWFRFFFKETIG